MLVLSCGSSCPVAGVKPEPKRKHNLSKLNNQAAKSSSSSLRNPLTQLSATRSRHPASKTTTTGSRPSQSSRTNLVSSSFHGKKSTTPSPSEVLNISDLTIGNQDSTESLNSRETGCFPVLDCDTDSLLSSNKNQSSSGSERENQSASSSSHSVTNRNSQSSSQGVRNRENQSAPNSVNQSNSSQDDSNQSTCEKSTNEELDSSLIIVTEDNTPSSPAQPRQYTCHVLHCQSVFTSREKRNHHMNQFRHSPCNPCLQAKDGKLLPDPVYYMCPQCDQHFKVNKKISSSFIFHYMFEKIRMFVKSF